MIKSRILNDLNNRGVNWGFIFLGIIVSVFLKSFLVGDSYSSPLELFIWYPVLIFTGVLLMIAVVKRFIKNWESFEDFALPIALLMGFIAGFLMSLLTFWSKAAASMPLTLSQVGTYFLTLGIYPFQAGPGGFLRGFAWAVALSLAIIFYKGSKDLFKAIIIGLAVWFAITVVFIAPSVILLLTMLFHSLPITTSGSEMVGEFTRLNLFSYWGDGQLLRWFTGFGGQATNALLLYSASWIFIVGSIVWCLDNLSFVKKLLIGFKIAWILPVICVLLFGYFAGASHQGWIGLDLAAWGVFVMVLILSWLHWRSVEKEVFQDNSLMMILWIMGCMLLGWPVLLGGLLLLASIYCKDQIKTLNLFNNWQWFFSVFVPVTMVLLFALFMRRGAMLDPAMLRIVMIFGLFALLARFINFAKEGGLSNLWMIGGWSVIAVLLWIVAGIFSPAAIMMLAGVFIWLFWQKIKNYNWKPSSMVWGVAIIVLLVVIWLPRLAHPELIPR